jgi:large subunit ribosomal protein L35
VAIETTRIKAAFRGGFSFSAPQTASSRNPVALCGDFGYKPPSERSGRACRGRSLRWRCTVVSVSRIQEEWSSKMPKMKTKSSAKKRFKITATGKVLSAAAGKRHGMIKRSNKFIRNARGTMVLAEPDGRKVIKNYLPNGL